MGKQHKSLMDFEVTPEAIAALKEHYGKIYKVKAADIDFIIRPLYKDDWSIIQEMGTSNDKLTMAEVDDKVVDLCLVGPRPDFSKGGWSALPAGIVPSLSMYIRAKSGFVVPEAPEALAVVVEPVGGVVMQPRPDKDTIDALKADCPFQLKMINIEGEWFVVRPITRQEWRIAVAKGQESGDESERDIETTKRVVMWPKNLDWDAKPVGYCETITNFALGISGYSVAPEVEEL